MSANTDSVVRFPYRNGDLTARGGAEMIVPHLPVGGHYTRDVVFSPDGRTMYVSVGSASNVGAGMGKLSAAQLQTWQSDHPLGAAWGDETERADVLAFDPQGKNGRIFATGIRNCVGMAIAPSTGTLWCSTNERDGLGDNLPPDYITRVREGAFYGWPWYYIGANEDPRHRGERADLKDKITVPDVLIQAHSASLGHDVLRGDAIPGGLSRQHLRRRARLVEPLQTHRLQDHPRDREGRRADRRVRRFRHRISWSTIPRSGAAPSAWPSTRTARCWSPRMRTAPSGASLIPARPRP